MPIYAYRCDACGFAKDVLQKLSDAPLSDCPHCQATGTFHKQLTAPGFQLKGSGWYVTDFRNGAGQSAATGAAAATESAAPGAAASTAAGGEVAASATPAAAGCGGGCACH